MNRPICATCTQHLAAVNYIRDGHHYYRKLCDSCIRKGKKFKPVPAWYKAGYRKKSVCDKCGFKAKFTEKQIAVYHLDGNLRNTNSLNLKSVCLNCRVEISSGSLPWKPANIIPDF